MPHALSQQPVAVVGAGTMGAGIAQTAAVAGHRVYLCDAEPGAAGRAVSGIRDRVKSLAAKGRLDTDPSDLDLIPAAVSDLGPCGVVIEAITEDLRAKQQLFAELEDVVAADCILASNTSSLSPAALAARLRDPQRLVGLHFFNPVPVMRLVEVVTGLATSAEVADAAARLAESWGKTVVRSASSPGFIVNRVARPFYAEAWRLYEERAAQPPVIDAVLTGAGGFRMGPFALMDLIGHDVNEAVTRSVWTGFSYDQRFAPSAAQRALVEVGWLGRKSGRGVYDYAGSGQPADARPAGHRGAPAEVSEHGTSPLRPLLERAGLAILGGDASNGLIELPSGALLAQCTGTTATELAARYGAPIIMVDRVLDEATATAVAVAASDGCPVGGIDEAVGCLQAAGMDVYVIDDAPGLIVTRTVAMLANFAADALQQQVASAADIDTAMRLGTNYPAGPLAWADRWGASVLVTILDAMAGYYRDGRYRASALLRRAATSGRPLG